MGQTVGMFSHVQLLPGSSVYGIFLLRIRDSGLLFPTPGYLLQPGIKTESPMSPALQVDSFTAEPLGKAHGLDYVYLTLKVLKYLIKIDFPQNPNQYIYYISDLVKYYQQVVRKMGSCSPKLKTAYISAGTIFFFFL